KHRLGYALHRVLVEIDVGRAEGQVEVHHHDLGLEQVRDAPADIVGQRRGTDTALGADKGDGTAERRRFRVDEDGRDDGNDLRQRHWRHHIFGHAGADEIAIETDIVVVADDDDLGTGVAAFRKLAQA